MPRGYSYLDRLSGKKVVHQRKSSLSLKSIHQKKVEKKSTIEENFDNHPKDTFTEKKLHVFWKEYPLILRKKGENNLASVIASGLPVLIDNFVINYSVPSKLMKDEFLKGRPKFLGFLREKLNNYGVSIKVTVNETIEKKFAYTPLEKYNKLKEKNPLIEKLRQSFELDL